MLCIFIFFFSVALRPPECEMSTNVWRLLWKRLKNFCFIFKRKVNEEKNGFLSDVSSSERPLFNFYPLSGWTEVVDSSAVDDSETLPADFFYFFASTFAVFNGMKEDSRVDIFVPGPWPRRRLASC